MEDTQALTPLEGTVTAILFQNEENGYTVLKLDTGSKEHTSVVGCLPGVALGESLLLHGTWGRHATFGEQFKAEVMERRIPTGKKAIYQYLASGAVKGIGAATAKKLVDHFGNDLFDIMETDPQRLTELKGLSLKRALQMGEAFRQQMGMRRLIDFLTEQELPLQLAMAIYRRFGDESLEIIQDNPYLLVNSDLGVSFGVADKLALQLGVEGDDPQRVEAALLFELMHNLNNGHSFLPRKKLLWATSSLIDLEYPPLEEGLESLLIRGEVVQETVAGEEACYLSHLQEAESYVALRLMEMAERELLPPKKLEQIIDDIETQQNITYAPQQRQAVELAAESQVMLLTGGPGTGKTTSLRGVLALFEALGLETALAAPTGRAAKRLGETCDTEAQTIHRLLETQFDQSTGQLVFSHGEEEPLEVDAVIVDETSMVDICLMEALVASLKGDCRLILVGDPDQLPSVGPGNLLSDLIRSGRIPMVRLTEIFRQATQSAIIMNAHQVNQGLMPDLKEKKKDCFFLRRKDPQKTVETIVELCSQRLPDNMGIPPEQIQVLSPTRKHATGTYSLNMALQAALNPPAEDKPERRCGSYLFRLGDRVMQVKNNYDIMWESATGGSAGMGVFNGDIGHITAMDKRGEQVTVDFDGKIVEYSPDMLNELEPAYAMTVHKAQGSEYRAVILALNDGAPMLLTRGVLYTALTRARSLLILVGDEDKVAQMVQNNRQQKRYSGLRARLVEGENPTAE